ncbi:MAG: formylglycine-generating enzyme family protein [Prolixibacteraceae bacterium]
MKRTKLHLYLLPFLFLLAGCKTSQLPPANYYNPVFDQSNKKYIRTASNRVDLDTLVLIRSNLREITEVFIDTLRISNLFIIERADLVAPLELINEKPPSYDTFLVVTNYNYVANYINTLFPVIPDSVLNKLQNISGSVLPNLDSLNATPSTKPGVKEKGEELKAKEETKESNNTDWIPMFLLSKTNRQAAKSRKLIEQNLAHAQEKKLQENEAAENGLADQSTKNESGLNGQNLQNGKATVKQPPKIIKQFYTKEEILKDSTRDLLDAASILDDLLTEAVWEIGDSIPFYQVKSAYFLDSALVFYFDTIYEKIFDPEKVVPQLAYDSLVKVHLDTIYDEFELFINETIIFKVHHPEIDDIYIPMVKVQGGTFKFGSNEYDDDERNAHNVSVSSYLLGRYEVTNKLFTYILNDMKCDSLGFIDGIKVIDLQHPLTKIRQDKFTKRFEVVDGYDDYPVVNVSWIGAQMFCKLAGGRLPSEAEWEYAAKGGIYAKRVYNNHLQTDYDYVNLYPGGNYMSDLGWIVDNSRGQVWIGGRKLPNELGLYDLGGNVWEWCYDNYSKDFLKRNGKSNNPMCLEGGTNRVNRGGSWSSDAVYCRSTNRNFLNQFAYNQYLGFRYMREWK